jgi:hypothetical protein
MSAIYFERDVSVGCAISLYKGGSVEICPFKKSHRKYCDVSPRAGHVSHRIP